VGNFLPISFLCHLADEGSILPPRAIIVVAPLILDDSELHVCQSVCADETHAEVPPVKVQASMIGCRELANDGASVVVAPDLENNIPMSVHEPDDVFGSQVSSSTLGRMQIKLTESRLLCLPFTTGATYTLLALRIRQHIGIRRAYIYVDDRL